MATDFFERQDAARRSTKWLVAMFLLGVIGIVGATMAVGVVAIEMAQDPSVYSDGAEASFGVSEEAIGGSVMAGLTSLALITGGSLYKVAQLSGGGNVVAENLGGRRVFPDTTDPAERRLLNVVEEMALASGVPVPPVFLLSDEEGINAFAAGYSPSDAVVAVTRGTAERLSREELQGVVAHEFSHILNGDMRLNIRLIGVLHGLLLIGLIGRFMLRMASNWGSGGSSKESKGGAAYFGLIGLALMVLGFLGTLIGNLIKAAVSRQREYLADASAVQFTRNPGGLAGALKRIGAAVVGSRIKAPNAAEASHMFFAQGVWEGFTALTATHPPLDNRIRRLEPNWDGTYPAEKLAAAELAVGSERQAGLVGERAAPEAARQPSEFVPVTVVSHASDQVGDPTERHRRYAATLVESLPLPVAQTVHEPYGARAVLFGLLLDRNEDIRQTQLARLGELASADIVELTYRLMPHLDRLDVRARLPLVDLALPSLRAMSQSQYDDFLRCFKELVAADQRLALFEWTLYRIVLRQLQPQFEKTAAPRAAYYGLQRMGGPCSVLLSTLAYVDRQNDPAAALTRGAAKLPEVEVMLLPPDQCGLEPLSKALDDLARVADKRRRHLVDACAACICADREVTVAEAELLRGICDMLDCPMPPLLPGGPVVFAHDGAAA